MKYINQIDYPHWLYVIQTENPDEAIRERGKTRTVRTSACGPCSAVIVADRLLPNCNFDLKAAIDLAYESRSNHCAGTDYGRYAPALCEKLGLRFEATNDPEAVRRCLRTGGAVVVYIGGDYEGHVGVFSTSGHYVVAVSEEPDGRIAILDPGYKAGKFDKEGRLGRVEVKNDVLCLCDMQVLVEDTANRDPGFYLFWRA